MKPFSQRIGKYKFVLLTLAVALGLAFVGQSFRAKSLNSGILSEPVQRGMITESIYGIGTVTATRSFQLKSGVTSTIRRLFVKEGDTVKRGQPLVDIEGTSLFTAPFDGTVTTLPFKVGESVFSQSIVLNLVDLTDRYVVVSLEQQGMIRVHHGQHAQLSFEGMREQSFTGKIESVYSSDTHFLVRIDTPTLPSQILPGMTADVAIAVSEHPNALSVPIAAVLNGRAYVSRAGAKPIPVEVKTGIHDGAMTELLSGDVQPGDRLLIQTKISP